MAALGLTVALFGFALLVGLALTVIVRRGAFGPADVLLAPATGFAVAEILVVQLNSIGIPVNAFAATLCIGLTLGALYCVVRIRRKIVGPLKQCAAFGVILLASLLLTASPMVSYGLDWFSYGNGDAVNYSFSAERVRVTGLHTPPNWSDFISDRDPTGQYYNLNGSRPERYGVDELLAFVSSVAHVEAFRALMPCLVALHMAGIVALGALVYRGRFANYNALLASAGLAISALATFGVDYQLFGQVGGLVFLSAFIARACMPEMLAARVLWRNPNWILAILLGAALCEAYPELSIFGLLTVGAYYCFRKAPRIIDRLKPLVLLSAGMALLLNLYLQNFLYVVFGRFKAGSGEKGNGLFPYYLLPTGLSNLFGLTPIAYFPSDPWMSVSIALGMTLLVLTIIAAIRSVRNDEPAGYLALLFVAMIVSFFIHESGFGLYKLAMYAQPAIVGVLAPSIVSLFARYRNLPVRVGIAVTVAALGLLMLSTQQTYVTASRASGLSKSASFVEIPRISDSHLLSQLSALRGGLSDGDDVVSDTFNIELGRLESFYTEGVARIGFPADDELKIAEEVEDPTAPFYDKGRYQIARALAFARLRRFKQHKFHFGSLSAKFIVDEKNNVAGATLWTHRAAESPFNRATLGGGEIERSSPATTNVLAFVASSLGEPYYTIGSNTSLFQLEPDIFFSDATMTGIGRYLLFEVLNPHLPIRVRLAFTNTLRADQFNEIPPASIIGTKRVFFPLRGRGSADVISGEVTPQVIGGRSYLLLDMGADPKRFSRPRVGLMALWGKHIEIDRRRLTVFLRDVSALGSDYAAPAPEQLTTFPDGLRPGRVEYSGIYEDGWASEDLTATLRVGNAGVVHVRGVVPMVGDDAFSTEASCFADGFPSSSERLIVGEADIPVMTGAGVHRVECRFSRYQRLPGADHRPVTMLLHSIG